MRKILAAFMTAGMIACGIGMPGTGAAEGPPGGKCGDGICDDFEKAHPNVCPQDCGGSTSSAASSSDSAAPRPMQGKCGDGICDDFEKAHPNVCPQDCGGSTSSASSSGNAAAPRPMQGKCGDGICDDFEKAHPNVCPQDCGGSAPAAPQPAKGAPGPAEPPKLVASALKRPTLDVSPFGVFAPFESDPGEATVAQSEIASDLVDLGVRWVQVRYWEEKDVPAGIGVFSRVGGEAHVESTNITDAYRTALRDAIRTYKGQIKYWEVGTEPSGFPPPRGWQNHPKDYAVFLRETAAVIKSECRDCSVVFGGLSGVGSNVSGEWPSALFLKDVLAAGGGKYIDAFEFKQHHYNARDYRSIGQRLAVYRKIFHDAGLDLGTLPVFLETATHDGAPSDPPESPLAKMPVVSQTEREQAAGLFKIYVYSITQGIKTVFWNLMTERHNFGGNPGSDFNHYGLIHNARNEGLSHRKLAYFTFKKMVEVLNGSDWKNTQVVRDQDDLFLCRFSRQGTAVWAAWNDRQDSRPLTLTGIRTKAVRVTQVVPARASGKDVAGYGGSFDVRTVTVVNGTAAVTLSDAPVLIEETP